MYKTQIILQKIICFAAIAVSALVFLYSLGLMTDLYDSLAPTMMDRSNIDDTWVPGSQIYYHMQPFNKALLGYSIGLILLSVFLFITSTHSRRRYYMGNVAAVALYAVSGVVLSVWSHIQVDAFKTEFLTKVDFNELQFFAEMWETPYIDSTFWFDAHYVVFGLVVLVAAALVANLCWKFSLMKAEKQLIEDGKKVHA
ncbi:MAG: hypothetical protein E7318_02950 [Clostridiales bacterium]|nr:hypothetical protein [Clostridiales bacterium]